MGHADLDMLAKRYAHNNVETLRKALQIDRPSHADKVIRYQCRNGVVVNSHARKSKKNPLILSNQRVSVVDTGGLEPSTFRTSSGCSSS